MTRATSIAVLVAMVILLATGAVPPQATSFFCQVVGTGSRTLVRLVDHTVEFSLLLAGLALLIVLALSRATWRPAAPVGVRQRRAAVWCAPDRCRRRLTAGQLSLPDSDRCVAGRSLGPHRPTVELEDVSILGALRRSGRLVRMRWLKASSLIVVGGAVVLVVGPLVGVLLILATDLPFWLVNVVAGVVYAVTMPFVALTTAYVYFDARVRHELVDEADAGELPAEIGLFV